MEEISIREYARRKGMSDTYIRRMIANGVISEKAMTTHPGNGRPMVIFEQAERDWSLNYHASRELTDAEIRKSKKADAKPKPPRPKTSDQPVDLPTGTLPDGRKSKAELDRLKAELQVQLIAIELRQKKGQLVEKEKVYRALYEVGQELLRDILAIPDKTLDSIRAAKTRQEAYRLMYDSLASALTAISGIKEGDIRPIEQR